MLLTCSFVCYICMMYAWYVSLFVCMFLVLSFLLFIVYIILFFHFQTILDEKYSKRVRTLKNNNFVSKIILETKSLRARHALACTYTSCARMYVLSVRKLKKYYGIHCEVESIIRGNYETMNDIWINLECCHWRKLWNNKRSLRKIWRMSLEKTMKQRMSFQ